MDNKNYRFETLALHGGQQVDSQSLSRGVPVHRTSAYLFKSAEHASNLFALKELGNIYTRLMNPTTDVLEKRISLLEGGAASVAFASGTSAIFNTIINIAKSGDEIVSAKNLYGGSYTMFDAILPQFGIKAVFADNNAESIEEKITDKTRAVFVETISNPTLDFTDIASVADAAHKHGVPLIVDGTFTTPYLLRTIDHGADIVVNSLSKWIGGHGTAIGGSVTDSGKFDWSNKKFSLFTEPDPNYHGLVWSRDLPDELAPVAFALRLRTVPLRNLGACVSPDNSWIFLQGLETLPGRMEKHSFNGLLVAEYLKNHDKVEWVRYPGLENDPSFAKAEKYLKNGFGGMVVFGIKGGKSSGEKFIDSLSLFSHLANVGDAKSLALHPGSTSHSQLNEKKQADAGLKPELVRLSVGLEHIEDILEDLESALKTV